MGQAEKAARSFGKAAENSEDDVKKLGKTAKQAGEEVKRFGDDSQASANKAEKAFSNLKSTIIGLGIGQALKTSITDAMNAVESESLFEVSLGDYANKARAWSEEMSKSLALDGYALRKNVGTLYSMTTSMGLSKDASYELSTGLSALAEDMASFYNLSSDEAFTKLRSGLTGEAEPLKAIGILVDEATVKQYAYRSGIAKTGEELTQQQKVLARYAAILGQTANAQGDLARTMDSPANQLRATMNGLKQESIGFGLALMPIVQTGLPFLRQGIEDIAPVATTFASGLSFIGQALQILENPVARGIVYAGVAAAAIRKLNLAIGSTASGLILIGSILTFVLGKYAEAEQKAEDTVATSMDGATVAIDSATTSTENLADSFGEVEKAVNRLAGFDEITKLSGGSSGNLGAQFYEAADAAENATSFIEDYEKALASVSKGNWNVSPELDLSKVDWSRLQADIKQISDDFTAIFTGDEQERYSALVRLNDKIKDLFGAEWSDFWQDVGNDIFNAFNDFGSDESYDALYNLNERIKSIPFSETFQNIGKSFGEGLANITAGIDSFLKGDFEAAGGFFEKAMGDSSKVVTEIVDNTPLGMFLGPVGQTAKTFSQVAVELDIAEQFENEKKKAVEMEAESQKGFYDTLAQMEATTKSYILQGLGADLALQRAKTDFYDPSDMFGGDFVQWYQELPASQKLEGKVEGWAHELRPYAMNSELNTPASAEDIYAIMQSAPGGGITGPINIKVESIMDGEKVGEGVATYNDNQIVNTNGR